MSNKRNNLGGLLNARDVARPQSALVKEQILEGMQGTVSTGIQEPVRRKKKATFDFDVEFHTRLKIFAARQGKDMVDVVTEAVEEYIKKYD